ncbi:hypothetical protein F66182_14249, partial [Fusarium sp. NRRL 66182]
EKDYEKIDKLIKLRREYAARLKPIEAGIEQERKGLDESDQEIMAGEWLSRRLDAGLFALQTIDVILAWLIAEDDGAKTKIATLLGDRDEDISIIKKTLQDQVNDLGEEDEGEKYLKDICEL